MPLFNVNDRNISPIKSRNFNTEKDLQSLVERNLEELFNCRFVATEFSTGATHAGRIDTLALSEDNNPVIIEYKKVESSELVNQSLYYLSWLNDHRGDFQVAAQKALGVNVEIDWGSIRVICLAPNYRKFDLHAVQVMGANIELWKYRLFDNSTLYLEEVFRRALALSDMSDDGSPLSGLTPGKKAAITRTTSTYTVEEHFADMPNNIQSLANAVREFVLGLDSTIEEAPKKYYIAYKIAQNIVCMELQRSAVILWVKLDPSKLGALPSIARDVRTIGHYGTGNLELSISTEADLEVAWPYIEQAYRGIGG